MNITKSTSHRKPRAEGKLIQPVQCYNIFTQNLQRPHITQKTHDYHKPTQETQQCS